MRKALTRLALGTAVAALALPFVAPAKPTEASTPVFFEDFNGSSLDTANWLVAKRQWGGANANGGVVPENVKVQNGKLVLEAHGDLYTGPVKGVNKDGTTRADGKRVGAAIATNAYYGSGSYEISMKVAPRLGVCSAVWTFHYQEVEPGDPQYQGSGDYYVVNHEIDIEIPGRTGPTHTNIGFDKALLNTWTGENEGEYTTGYTNLGKFVDDNQFHTYRFDWHTGGNGETKRVDFYLDGVFLRSATADVPDIAGRLWLGAWFPNGWTGTPNFDTDTFEIDWVRITPFDEPGDRFLPETYPNDGWATPVTDTQAPTAPTNLSSPSKTSTSVQLNWTASTDNIGVTGYDVYRNGSVVQTVTGTSANVTGLTPSTAYGFYVKAKDGAGNASAASPTINVTTSASAGDTQPPTAPTNLTSPSKTATSVQLSWTASTDNVGVTGYEVYRNGNLAQTVTGTTANVAGLTASTAYSFYVKAKDAAGNLSPASATLNVTTNAASGGGNLIANGDFSSASGWTDLSRNGGAASISGGQLSLNPTNTGIAEVEQYVAVTPGTTYTLSAKMWNSGSNTWSYLRVYNNGVLSEAGYNGNAAQTKTVTFTATTNQIRVVLHAYKQQTGTFYYDDVTLN